MRMMYIISLLSLIICCNPADDIDSILVEEQESSLKYLALGDSYTIGESVEEAFRWPNILKDSLNAKGLDFQKPQIIAKTGWRTDQLMESAQQNAPDTDYDLVSLLIGVNNQYQGRSADDYKVEFEELLKFSIERAGGDSERVLVLSIPDYGCTPFGQSRAEQIGKEIDQFNLINRDISMRYNVAYVDITGISREAKGNPNLVASDNLHPSADQYLRWVEEVLTNESLILELKK